MNEEALRMEREAMERLIADMRAEYKAGADGYFLIRREMKRVLDALTQDKAL